MNKNCALQWSLLKQYYIIIINLSIILEIVENNALFSDIVVSCIEYAGDLRFMFLIIIVDNHIAYHDDS